MGKKILNIVGDVVLVAILILAVLGIIYGLSTRSNGGVPKLFGKSAYTVPTTSMDITKAEAKSKGFNSKTLIKKGDLVFGDSNVKYEDIQIGDVIFFWGTLNENDESSYVIVHRVVDVRNADDGSILYLVTRGDNPSIPLDQTQQVSKANYIAKLSGKIGGFGNVILFLTSNTWINYVNKDGIENTFLKGLYDFKLPIGFGLIIVLPILIYLIVMIVRLIGVLNNNRKVDTMNDIAAGVVNEDAKEAIIQEYLRKQEELARQKAEQDAQAQQEKPSEENPTTDNNTEE